MCSLEAIWHYGLLPAWLYCLLWQEAQDIIVCHLWWMSLFFINSPWRLSRLISVNVQFPLCTEKSLGGGVNSDFFFFFLTAQKRDGQTLQNTYFVCWAHFYKGKMFHESAPWGPISALQWRVSALWYRQQYTVWRPAKIEMIAINDFHQVRVVASILWTTI